MDFKRGDIIIVNLNPKKGDEVGKIRPAVIISNDLIDNMEPYRMRIPQRENLKEDSDLLINQVKTLSKSRIKEKIATVTDEEYKNIIQNLCKNFS